MKAKVVNIINYVVKLLAVVLSVYFIGALVYKNPHVSISLDFLMFGIITLIVLDYLMFVLECYRDNVLLNKVIRGCMWAVAACVCSKKGIIFLFIISVVFFMFISKEKRKLLDIPFTLVYSCIFMEVIGIIGMVFNGAYRHMAKELNESLVIDIMLIIVIVLYICSDKVTDVLTKIPSIEKCKEENIGYAGDGVVIEKQMIYVGTVFLGVLLGLHMYSSLCINKGYLHILIASIMILLQIVILYALFTEVFKDLDRVSRVIISIGVASLPCINYKNYSLKSSLMYLVAFTILFCVFKFLKNNKIKWLATIGITIVGTVILFLNGFYMIPIINVLAGVIFGKVIQKNKHLVISICIFMIICSQYIVGYIFIEPIKEYDRLISECTSIDEKVDADIYYVGEDARVINMLNDSGIICYAALYDTISSRSVIIFDKSIPEKVIMHKYVAFKDDKFIVCFNDEDLAQQYQNLGGECYREEYSPEYNINYDVKTHEANVFLTGVTEGYHDISAAVWCEKTKLDDRKWYSFENIGDGVFKATIDLTQYSKDDQINIHVYGTFEDEESSFIVGIGYSISGK